MQYDWGVMDPVPTTGVDLAADLNSWRTAVHTGHLGANRPVYAQQGMLWVKSSGGSTFTLLVFDGVRDLPLATWDTSVGRISAAGGVPIGGIIDWSGTASALPTGWALCDGGTYQRSDGTGTIKTPDLRGLFIICASPTIPVNTTGGSAAGATVVSDQQGSHNHSEGYAGSHSHDTGAAGGHNHAGVTTDTALQIGHLPPHQHSVPQGAGRSTGGSYGYRSGGDLVNDAAQTSGATGSGVGHNHGVYTDGTHTHSVSPAGDHTHTINYSGTHAHNVPVAYPAYYALAKVMRI